jgi:hypothetical protein
LIDHFITGYYVQLIDDEMDDKYHITEQEAAIFRFEEQEFREISFKIVPRKDNMFSQVRYQKLLWHAQILCDGYTQVSIPKGKKKRL